jgi:hypothetical protein
VVNHLVHTSEGAQATEGRHSADVAGERS